jgi:hypothetical protein
VVTEPDEAECKSAEASLAAIDRLRLSQLPATEALVRTVLRRAAASSPAALAVTLRRYRNLLLHARDAAAAGRPLERAMLRRFAGELEDQLVWWELMPRSDEPHDLQLDDLERIDQSLREAITAEQQADAKVERLRSIVRDGRPTLVFTSRQETVRYLRDRLGPPSPAWCTGTRAGVGHCRMPCASVLSWFQQGEREGVPLRSRLLLVTDVAAEGLDLQRACRVIHYDLPWTPMRMEQREGRALRLGSRHREVEVVAFTPPEPMERALRITQALASKARLPGAAGLGHHGRGLWRWRAELAEAYRSGDAGPGTAVVPCGPAGVLAGFELHGVAPDGEHRLASTLAWIEPGGTWTEEERIVSARLDAAAHAGFAAPEPDRLREALPFIGAVIRSRLGLARGSRWTLPASDPVAHRVSFRLHQCIREAARRRDLAALGSLERALGLVGRGHTAGESLMLERLAYMPEPEFVRKALRLPAPGHRGEAIEARLGGVLLFVPG